MRRRPGATPATSSGKPKYQGADYSTPAIWGDRIFVTTAIPTGKPAAAPSPPKKLPHKRKVSERRGRGGLVHSVEHNFDVLALDRKTGKILWQRTAKIATPHEGYHRAYGSFASNSPATDGKYVYASFGSRGIYCYDFNGKLIWEKDLSVQMKMRLAFGEGSAPLLVGDRLFLVFDHEAGSFIVALDKRNGKELWRATREEPSSWSTPLAIDHDGRTEIVVSATNKVRSYDAETGKSAVGVCGIGFQRDSGSCLSEWNGLCDEWPSRSKTHGHQARKARRLDRIGCDCLESYARCALHRLARALRQQTLRRY